MPTNGFLFEIASNIYLDECKKRGRQKRGGTANHASEAIAPADQIASAATHPREMLDLNEEDASETRANGIPPKSLAEPDSRLPAASVDPTSQYEDDDLFEKFYRYLRKPLTDSIESFQSAPIGKIADAERKKVETLTAKFDRMTAVLALMGEGYTQEETAEQLELSRNQVKYSIESVQEAYLRFSATSTHVSTRPTTREESNAR